MLSSTHVGVKFKTSKNVTQHEMSKIRRQYRVHPRISSVSNSVVWCSIVYGCAQGLGNQPKGNEASV